MWLKMIFLIDYLFQLYTGMLMNGSIHLPPRMITNKEVLVSLFVEKYFPRTYPYALFLKLVDIQIYEKETTKDFTFRFMKVFHEIPQEMFPNDSIIFICCENSLPTNMRYLLKQDKKCN